MTIRNDSLNYPAVGHGRFGTPKQITVPVEITLTGSPAAWFAYTPTFKIAILKMKFVVSTAVVATSTAPQVDVAISGGANTLASGAVVTIANSSAALAICASADVDIPVDAGETITFNLKTQAAGGTVAGKGYIILDVVDRAV